MFFTKISVVCDISWRHWNMNRYRKIGTGFPVSGAYTVSSATITPSRRKFGRTARKVGHTKKDGNTTPGRISQRGLIF
jgi:hypothetical protein